MILSVVCDQFVMFGLVVDKRRLFSIGVFLLTSGSAIFSMLIGIGAILDGEAQMMKDVEALTAASEL